MQIRTMLSAFAGAAAVALGGCATTGDRGARADSPIVGPIREGRCHMNGCSWFQVQSFDMVRETADAALLRVVSRDGSSMHPDGNYPRRPRETDIQWAPESSTSYFFCSTRYPAIIYDNEGVLEGYRLNMIMSAGATEFVHAQYRAICHPDGGLEAPGAAARLGYTSFDGEAEFRLSRPEDIFDRAN